MQYQQFSNEQLSSMNISAGGKHRNYPQSKLPGSMSSSANGAHEAVSENHSNRMRPRSQTGH